jgi:hypothetical protein
VQRGLGVGAHPVEDLLVGLDLRPGLELAVVVRRERGSVLLMRTQPRVSAYIGPMWTW